MHSFTQIYMHAQLQIKPSFMFDHNVATSNTVSEIKKIKGLLFHHKTNLIFT